jgi:hypothetical protein
LHARIIPNRGVSGQEKEKGQKEKDVKNLRFYLKYI